MKILSLDQLREEHKRLTRTLARAVGRKYPVGAAAWVKRGRGEMLARIAFPPCEWSEPTRLRVISANGRKVHSCDYTDVRLIGCGR
jgi:hypothetical protein